MEKLFKVTFLVNTIFAQEMNLYDSSQALHLNNLRDSTSWL